MLPDAACCVCTAPAGPHNYYGARVSPLYQHCENNMTLCSSHASPAERSSGGQWRRILSLAISATKQKYVGETLEKI